MLACYIALFNPCSHPAMWQLFILRTQDRSVCSTAESDSRSRTNAGGLEWDEGPSGRPARPSRQS